MEAPKQENSTSEASSVVLSKPPVLQIDVKKLDANMLKTAESIGIPIGAILQYVNDLQNYNLSVEQRLEAIIENFEPAVKATINKMMTEARSQQVQAQPQQIQQVQAQPQGGGLLSLLNLIPPDLIKNALGQATSSPSTALAEKYNELMIRTIDAKIAEIVNPPENPFEQLGKVLVNEIVSKTASKAAVRLGETLAP